VIVSNVVHLLNFFNSSPSRYQVYCCGIPLLLFATLLVPLSSATAASNVGIIDLSQLEPIKVSPKLVGTMNKLHINESSGLATSSIHDGVMWTLNDSGNSANIFPITLNGTSLNISDVSGFSIENAQNFDWEAMTSDHNGTLYIADSGQNFNFARTPIIYQIDEPGNLKNPRQIPLLKKIPYNYEDQSGIFMPRNEFDVEAMFYSDNGLNFITKGWGDSISKWYRLRQSSEFGHIARLVTRINFGKALITGAEVDDSGLRLAVLAKRSIWLFTRSALGQNWFIGDIQYLRSRDIGVTEAITFYGNRLYISNEGGELYAISLDEIEKHQTAP